MRCLGRFGAVIVGAFVFAGSATSADEPDVILRTSSQFVVVENAAPAAGKTSESATHRESKRVVVRGEGNKGTLQTFCMSGDGKVYGLVAKSMYDAGEGPEGGEVCVLAADGKELNRWKLDFTPQRIAAAPDGSIYVGGSGKLARFDTDGVKQSEVESPHVAAVLADKAVLRKAAEEQKASTIENYEQQLKSFTDQIKTLEEQAKKDAAAKSQDDDGAKAEPKKAATSTGGLSIFGLQIVAGTTVTAVGEGGAEDLTDHQLKQFKQLQQTYQQMLDREKKRTVEDVERDIAARLQRVHGISVAADTLFVATAMEKGYGYAVWRMTPDFKEAKQIVTGLSGCCGQIDIQARDGALFVAENSRHRVVKYDREGKRLDTWGNRDREGAVGGFGGCCNPMNLCFMPDGNIVTSESEGLIKCFAPDGQYSGLLGSAKVSGGCKNVAVAVSPDGKRAYFYDQQGSQIFIFERSDSADEPKKSEDSKQVSLK